MSLQKHDDPLRNSNCIFACSQISSLIELPKDLLLNIFSNLPGRFIHTILARVCRSFRHLVQTYGMEFLYPAPLSPSFVSSLLAHNVDSRHDPPLLGQEFESIPESAWEVTSNSLPDHIGRCVRLRVVSDYQRPVVQNLEDLERLEEDDDDDGVFAQDQLAGVPQEVLVTSVIRFESRGQVSRAMNSDVEDESRCFSIKEASIQLPGERTMMVPIELASRQIGEDFDVVIAETKPWSIDYRMYLRRHYALHPTTAKPQVKLVQDTNVMSDLWRKFQLKSSFLEGICMGDRILMDTRDRHEFVRALVKKSQTDPHLLDPDYYTMMIHDDGDPEEENEDHQEEEEFDPHNTKSPTDRFGRKYHLDIKFQREAIPIQVNPASKSCHIQGNIPGLPRHHHGETNKVYQGIERILSDALPLVERVFHSCTQSEFFPNHNCPSDEREEDENETPQPHATFGVIPQLINPRLLGTKSSKYHQPWHVQGHPNEQVVCTILVVLENSDGIETTKTSFPSPFGDLLVQRPFSEHEVDLISRDTLRTSPQTSVEGLVGILEGGAVPVGRIALHPGRCVVFPNTHVTKVTGMPSEACQLLYLHVVDPGVSFDQDGSNSMSPPPSSGIMSLEKRSALWREAVQERRLHGQDYCESMAHTWWD